MSDKQAVVEIIQRLPEGASLEEIADEVQILTSVRKAREDVQAGRTQSQDAVKQTLASWITKWS